MSFNQQLISKNILQNSTVLDFQKVSKFNQMQLFNMGQYNDKDGNIFLIPNFIQLYNYKNKKREIFLNKDYIEYILSFDSPTIEIILDRLTEAEINITDLQNDKLDTSEAYNVFYQKINLPNATKYVLSQTNNVLSLWNIALDYYNKTEIDDAIDNIVTLLDLKLTQPVNITAGQQIIAINPDQSVQLINASGLNYVSEDTANKTLNFDINNSAGIISQKINSIDKIIIDQNDLKLRNTNSIQFRIQSSDRLIIDQTEFKIYNYGFDWILGDIQFFRANTLKISAGENNTVLNNIQSNDFQIGGNSMFLIENNSLKLFGNQNANFGNNKNIYLTWGNTTNSEFLNQNTRIMARYWNQTTSTNNDVILENYVLPPKTASDSQYLQQASVKIIYQSTRFEGPIASASFPVRTDSLDTWIGDYIDCPVMRIFGYQVRYNTPTWRGYGWWYESVNGTTFNFQNSNVYGPDTNNYYYRYGLYVENVIIANGLVANSSSSFIKKNIEKQTKEDIQHLEKDLFDYDIFKYQYHDQKEKYFYGLINDELKHNQFFQDQFCKQTEYQLICKQDYFVLKKEYSFEDLQFFFDYQNRGNKYLYQNFFIIRIIYKEKKQEDVSNEYILEIAQNELYKIKNFNKEFSIEELEKNNIQVFLLNLSFSIDQEKLSNTLLIQNKLLHEKIEKQQKQIEYILSKLNI